MGIFKTRKNKRFNYSPRYWDDQGEGNPYEFEQKFDKYRATVGKNKNLKEKFSTAWEELRSDTDNKANRRIIIIAAILLLIFLYLINFDIAIFFTRS